MLSVSLHQVLPVLVARLPLKEDMEENKTVFNCLTMLYTKSPQLVLHNINLIFLCFELVESFSARIHNLLIIYSILFCLKVHHKHT